MRKLQVLREYFLKKALQMLVCIQQEQNKTNLSKSGGKIKTRQMLDNTEWKRKQKAVETNPTEVES
jgi:hypothetical protein